MRFPQPVHRRRHVMMFRQLLVHRGDERECHIFVQIIQMLVQQQQLFCLLLSIYAQDTPSGQIFEQLSYAEDVLDRQQNDLLPIYQVILGYFVAIEKNISQ
ncbi:hypothetical protein CCP2SC5_330035 [Azospirillaceae bacterium]